MPAVRRHCQTIALYRFAGAFFPYDRRFALVRNPNRGDFVGFRANFFDYFFGDGELTVPNLQRIMLNPTGFGEI